MSSAKIVVLSLKEIIRVALIVLFGIFVIVCLSFIFFPDDTAQTNASGISYKNGEYTAQIDIDKGQSFVQVTIDNHVIADVQIVDQDETASTFYPLFAPICQAINEKLVTDNTINIETDYYNQFTTKAITDAIGEALQTAQN